MLIMALDPGGTTGWAAHDTESPEVWQGGEIDPEKRGHHGDLWKHLIKWVPDHVVCENFLFGVPSIKGPDGEKVQMPKVELISREYIGIAKLYCGLRRVKLKMQNPSIMATNWCTDDSLKRLGIHTSGAPHRNDATRHLFYYLVSDLGLTDYLRPLRRR